MNQMEDKQYQQKYFQMLLEKRKNFVFEKNDIVYLQPMMQRKIEDVYQLPLILFSAKNNEFDH
jgi:hypothetical protein